MGEQRTYQFTGSGESGVDQKLIHRAITYAGEVHLGGRHRITDRLAGLMRLGSFDVLPQSNSIRSYVRGKRVEVPTAVSNLSLVPKSARGLPPLGSTNQHG